MSLQKDLERLNEQQANIVKKFSRPSLVVAGPGTGKTRTVSVLIGKLLEEGVRLKEILALTFSDKAANELKTRVLEYFPKSFDECWISTFHSFCARILREQYFTVGVKPDFKLLTGFKEALMLSQICSELDPEAYPEYGKVLNKRGFQQEVLTFISLLKSNLISSDEFNSLTSEEGFFDKRSQKRFKEVASLFKLYEREREKTGYLDFRDLIALTIKALQNKNVARLYAERFRVIIVDEFQDTDPAQFHLLTLLSEASNDCRIAVIGDPRQSIYRFRGANPEMMTPEGPFKKRFRAKVFPLQINYRCAREILETSSRLDWHNKSLGKEDNLIPASEQNGFVSLFKARDELEEARLITRKVASLIVYGREKKYKPSDIAILVRNNFQIDLLAESLQTLHIPFEIAGDMKFFKSEEVVTLASLLKASAQEGNDRNEALQRAFASPIFKLAPLWVQGVFAQLSPTFNMTNALEDISEGCFDRIPITSEENLLQAQSFASTVQLLENCINQPLSAIFARLLLALKQILADPSSEGARNALHFRNMIADYCELFVRQRGREATVSDLMPEFDEWLTYYASTLEQEQAANDTGIKIMTVHQSKGLEFPVVVLSGLCEEQFPVKQRENLLIGDRALRKLKQKADSEDREIPFFNPYPDSYEDHLEEERRLFYVALTRAKEGLILSYPERMGTDIAIPSPFLKEIGLSPEKIESEQRPLTISEVRTILAKIPEPQRSEYLDELEKEIPPIPADYSIYGIRPRTFSTAKIDQIGVPEDFSFSASSIKNYIDCPRKFFFQNILRIQDPLSLQRSYFQMGHAVHDLFEKLHHPQSIWSKGKLPDENDLKELFAEFSQPHLEAIEFFERHSMSEKIFQALPDYINAIYSLEQVPPRSTIGVEHKFRFDFRGFKFSGRFDRLVKLEKGVAVVDYKTTESNKSSQKVYDLAFPQEGMPMEIQLPLYLLACKAGGNPVATAILLYAMKDPYKKKYKGFEGGHLKAAALNLGTGPIWGNTVSENDFATFEDRLEKILKQIVEDRVFDCVPTDHSEARTCLHSVNNKPGCDFLPFCEERLEALKKGREQ